MSQLNSKEMPRKEINPKETLYVMDTNDPHEVQKTLLREKSIGTIATSKNREI